MYNIPSYVLLECSKLEVQPKTFIYNNSSIFYVEKGIGTPIVLIHGLDSSFYTWRNVLKGLGKSQRLIAIDLPGFGCSESLADNTYDSVVNFLKFFLKEKRIAKCILCGHSFGGIFCQSLLSACPEIPSKLVLVSSPEPAARRPSRRVSDNLLLHGYYNTKVLTADFFKMLKAVKMKTPENLQTGIFFPEVDRSAKMKIIPCLLVAGDKDIVIPKEKSAVLKSLYPQNIEVIIAEAGHLPHEEAPNDFLNILNSFCGF